MIVDAIVSKKDNDKILEESDDWNYFRDNRYNFRIFRQLKLHF